MQFKIKVIAVELTTGTTKTNKPYKIADTSYRDLGQDKVTSRKVTEYNKAYEVIAKAKPGEVYEITASKKEGISNWDWDVAVLSNDASGNVSQGPLEVGVGVMASATRSAPKSTYETPEERVVKQAAINRSAAVARAIEFLEANQSGKGVFTITDVISVANSFNDYISNGDKSKNPFADMKDDLVD